MTTTRAVVDLALSLVGQKVTVPENPYGGQCASLIDFMVRQLTGYKMAYTNACDFLILAKKLGFKVTYDAPGLAPKAGAFYVITTDANYHGHTFGHIGVAVADSDGYSIEGVEQNVDGYVDANGDGINDQLQIGGGGYTRRVSRQWHTDGNLYSGNYLIGRVIGWFELPGNRQDRTVEAPTGAFVMIPETGTFTVGVSAINVRNSPETKGQAVATYVYGQVINYDHQFAKDGYLWISYVSSIGVRRYVATGPCDDKGNRPVNSIWGWLA